MTSILRSVLFVPGTRSDRFDKAFASGADAVVLDLEDGVDPARKADARRAVADWLARPPAASSATRLLRVNNVRSPWIADDLAWLPAVAERIDAVVLPKAESAHDVDRVAAHSPSRRVIPLCETARGIVNAVAIAAAHAEIPALLFGAEDLTAELGIPRTLAGDEILLARSQIVLAAATVGAEAIDAVFVDFTSPDRLRDDATRARGLGFRGKMAIHPDQVATINEVFTPSPEEVAAAQRIVDADAAAHARGEGAFRLDNRMVDAPVVARARKLLATRYTRS